MLNLRFIGRVGVVSALVLCTQLAGHAFAAGIADHVSTFSRANTAAVMAREGDVKATTEVAQQLFSATGISPEIADAFGFTERIKNAEIDYRHHAHPDVHEQDVVLAVNRLANTLGAPAWAQTSQPEIRKLRMHMLVIYPQLLVSEQPFDSDGRGEAVDANLRPMEAAYLATYMLYQKAFNAEYQMTDQEKIAEKGLPATARNKLHLERTQEIQDLVHGKTQSSSVTDLLAAADRMYDDIGIHSSASPAPISTTTISGLGTPKHIVSKATTVVVACLGVFGLIGFRKKLSRTKLLAALLVIGAVGVGVSGCGSSSPNAPYDLIVAEITGAGVTQAWTGATVQADAIPGQYNCGSNPCSTAVTGTTNSSGDYTLESWAIPGTWNIAIQADNNCSSGASAGLVQLSASGQTLIYCGTASSSSLSASPTNCYKQVNTSNNSVTTNCPMAIQLTSKGPLYPTSHAMAVGLYSESGSSLSSSKSTATSSTTLSTPTPGFASTGMNGTNIVVVRDSVTNAVMGATDFGYSLYIYSGSGPRVVSSDSNR